MVQVMNQAMNQARDRGKEDAMPLTRVNPEYAPPLRPSGLASRFHVRFPGVALCGAILLLAMAPGPVLSQPGGEPGIIPSGFGAGTACMSRQDVLDQLRHLYGERPTAMARVSNGGVMELLQARETGSWTMVLTMPEGTSCLIAAGDAWLSLESPASDSVALDGVARDQDASTAEGAAARRPERESPVRDSAL